ncbi:DUF58 domain-containing protein [Microbulbifer thermotolerans]|uniref:DUF58 domain-containing protein n=1 Tax=Microbulbifer thermotolerans TaxID=252514 RepID=UPI0008DEB2FB|nr:DUF58 domain-containing protein [Microbulbifer thermotolerans]MCX2830319.1 DUF58 domain-containing protein [Microbulbifer thermotolerans]WKT60732.1 DUF58 domain-containing protein [Microbulbifer thermotolerans]SFC30255.1 Protein of unknown function DUF58 [Microbulbifer thermotolerans]
MEFTDPLILASTRDLLWLSRHIAEGMLLGAQHSHQRGAGIEFQQYRSYEPGDSIRHIDWKLFARSDRYYVREAEQESQMHVCIALDTSASMAQPSFIHPQLTKLQYAKCWIATLCWLLHNQGDRFSLLALSDSGNRHITEGRGEAHHRRLVLELQQLQAGGHWPAQAQLETVWQHFEKPCQVVLISDFFEPSDTTEISDFATRLHAAGRPCLPLQLLVEAEKTFPFDGDLKIRNPESPAIIELNAKAQRADYLRAFAAAQNRLAARFAAQECPLTSVTIEEPLEQSLRRFIRAHSRFGGGIG